MMEYATTILGVCAVAFVILYVSGRYYLREGFEEETSDRAKFKRMAELHAPSVYNTTAIREDIGRDLPYATKPIMTLDDYEYSMVFQNEGNREAGKFEISQAMTRYPLDWCARPPSDQLFQTSREGFTDQVAKEMVQAPVTDEYDSISGDAEQPEDTQQIDEDERKLLQTYKPESTKDLLNYSLMDAKQLARRLYKKQGLIPVIEPSKQGQNVFEIVELKEINPKIVWEDEVQNPEYRTDLRGEGQIEVPQIVNDTAAGLDPFFEPRTTVRMDRHDSTKWTPGLERTFAPTYTGNGWA
jgi:hypothetical protein